MTPSITMTRKPSSWLAKTKTTRLLSGSFCFVIVIPRRIETYSFSTRCR